ncbi:hypothetical protein HC928_12780 [bacterium]|nr:hypothetical protein [bacterium]
MRLHEYEAKLRLAEFGIPVPEGRIAAHVQSASQAASDLAGPVMVKAQVLLEDRGAQRGIRRAETPGAAAFHARELLEHPLQDRAVSRVLIERVVDIKQAFYVAITHDRSSRKPVLVVTLDEGFGADTDETAPVLREYIAPPHRFTQLSGHHHRQSVEPATRVLAAIQPACAQPVSLF